MAFACETALQEEGRGTINKRIASVHTLLIIFLSIFVIAGVSSAKPFYKPEPESITASIRQVIKSLEYSDKTGEDFIEMISSWDFGRAVGKLDKFKKQLWESNLLIENDTANLYNMAQIEKRIAKKINSMITAHIQSNDEIFELPETIKKHQANCLGFTQMFYIMGTCAGLKVQPINVIEFESDYPEAPGTGHIACIVRLADDMVILVNPVPNGSTSKTFKLLEKYTKTDTILQLKDEKNPLNLYRSIQILNNDGLLSQLYNSRGCEFSDNNLCEQAVACFTKSIELNPDYPQAYNNRGVAYRKTGLFDKAISDYERAIEIYPNYSEAYNNCGIVYRLTAQQTKALKRYDKAIELNPKFAQAYNNRAILNLDMGKTEKSIYDFSKAIKLNKKLFQAYYNRAVAYSFSQELERAICDFNRAIRLNPDLPALYYGRANIYARMKKFEAAIEDYNRAIELDPEFTKARDNLQIAYALASDSKSAK